MCSPALHCYCVFLLTLLVRPHTSKYDLNSINLNINVLIFMGVSVVTRNVVHWDLLNPEDFLYIYLYNSLQFRLEDFWKKDYCGKIEAAVVCILDTNDHQFQYYLRYEILVDPLQLGLLSPIFSHHCLFVELMSQISILIKIQRAASNKKWISSQVWVKHGSKSIKYNILIIS